jgi:hypothetical protein
MASRSSAFADLAALFRHKHPNGRLNRKWDEKRYKEWGLAAVDVAKALAPYQSPTFKAIGIAFQNLLVAEQGGSSGDPDEPVRYPTVHEIRSELARRGLPPLRHLIEGTIIDETPVGNGHDDASGSGGGK